MTEQRPIKALGEIAFRVEDLDTMQDFYERVVGLELMRRFPDYAFFRVAEGVGGHTQILALFDRSARPDYQGIKPEYTTVDHIAFEIELKDYDSEVQRLQELGVRVVTKTHAWTHWRAIFIWDPEGNCVELVCFDPSVE